MDNDFDPKGEAAMQKPEKKNFKKTARRLRDKAAHLGHRASVDWRLDVETVCDATRKPAAVIPVATLLESLSVSRTAADMLAQATDRPLNICYDAQNPGSQFYPRDNGFFITLNPNRPRGDLMNALVRELRHMWQYNKGALVNPLDYDPDEAILINRAQAADALMMSVKVAWELKLAGDAEAWNWLAGSPAADVGRCFENRARDDFRTLNNGTAARAAYDKFFEDSRTKIHDKKIIHQMLLDEAGYMRSIHGTGPAPREVFERLGQMPGGENYLTRRHDRPPTSTDYMQIEDRSNANFLWFIKFERSFQQKEKEMLEESVRRTCEIIDFAKWSLSRTRA